MNLVSSVIDKAKRTDLRFAPLDGNQYDVIIFATKKWPRMGLILGDEALILDYKSCMSFRVKSGNLGFSDGPFRLARVKRPLDKCFLEKYFRDNRDNPYGIQNIMNLIERQVDITIATQFPPLYLPKLCDQERKSAVNSLIRGAQKGDFVFSTSREHPISAAVRKYDRSQFSHVAVYLGEGEVADIGPAGGVVNSLFDSDDDTHFALYTTKAVLSDESRENMASSARALIDSGIQFNYKNLFLMYLRKRFNFPVMRKVPSVADLLYSNHFDLMTYF